MGYEVFISYSTQDQQTALDICRLLEAQGIRCWVAPRDILPGKNYAEQIIAAIEGTRIMVLILSDHANASIFVKNEVERAISKGKIVIPFRIQNVQPSRSLELFISTSQWIDAWTPPLEARVQILGAAIRGLLGLPLVESNQATELQLPPHPRTPSLVTPDIPGTRSKASEWRLARAPLVAIIALVMMGILVWLGMQLSASSKSGDLASATQTVQRVAFSTTPSPMPQVAVSATALLVSATASANPPANTLQPTAASSTPMVTIPVPATEHPRLLVRAADLPRLRSWATLTNSLFRNGLGPLAEKARSDMDSGKVPAKDTGGHDWEQYPTEMYAELFAFMSLISGEQPTREDYARRARSLLMHVINEAAKGPAEGQPFRDPKFVIPDSRRAQWWGESFPLTVDWIYPYLSASDKAAIHKVFSRWSQEIVQDGCEHPPVGVLNDPSLLFDRERSRSAGSSCFDAQMRNLGLMAMALDPPDDPGNQLGKYLSIATGAHLYMVDYQLHNDARGGLGPQGFGDTSESFAYVIQFLLALHTAGRDNTALLGPQVSLLNTFFPGELVTAYLHSLSPVPVKNSDMGMVYQPAWYGDGENYFAPDFIMAFAPLALYDRSTGNLTREAVVRWIQTHMAPGGANLLVDRVARTDTFLSAIFYFMLFDPGAPSPSDPRPPLPLAFLAQGLGKLFARTDWTPDATWFTFGIGWASLYGQHGDGNQLEFYRRGEWLTKERTGNDLFSSDYHNTLALENDPPERNEPTDYRHALWLRGSQWIWGLSGDGRLVSSSSGKGYVYALGDATALYNSEYENSIDIVHASRSVVWLQPDHIVVYDRAVSKAENRFKRFWLNLPDAPSLSGKLATLRTAKGQQLFVNTLLPANAAISAEPAETGVGEAHYEPMRFRLRVEAPGGPRSVRFLHVLQGADSGATPTAVSLIQTTSGTPFAGALVGSTAVLFPVDVGAPGADLSYTVPTNTTAHLITGLAPNSGYDVTLQPAGDNTQVTVRAGNGFKSDAGGVLVVGTLAR